MNRWGVLLLALIILPTSVPVAATEHDDGLLRPRLYFESWPDMYTAGNFSATPPTGNPVPQRPHPIDQETQRIHWDWWLDRLPAPWVIREGAAIEVVVYMDRLDQTIPPIDPLGAPDSIGQARLIARLDHLGETNPVAEAAVDVPTGTDVGADATVEVRITMTATRDAVYPTQGPPRSASPLFGLNLTMIAIASNRAYPSVHVDRDAPSYVEIEGFPIAAFHGWENAETAFAECNAAILRGEECAHADDGEGALQATPAAAPVLLLTALGLLLGRARRHRGNDLPR